MKILIISDPHYDFHSAESDEFYAQDPGEVDCVVVAGDVSNFPEGARDFFMNLKRFPCPKFAVPGNHDEWWGANRLKRNDSGPRDWHPTFQSLAEAAGFKTPNPAKMFEVVDDVLLFNLFYKPPLTAQQIDYTNDPDFMNVHAFEKEIPAKLTLPPVRFSVSHIAPRIGLPSQYKDYHPMYWNPDVDVVLRAAKSPVHFFGHTHEWLDETQESVRYVNRPVGYDAPKDDLSAFVVTT